jgi:hypothetical protein
MNIIFLVMQMQTHIIPLFAKAQLSYGIALAGHIGCAQIMQILRLVMGVI